MKRLLQELIESIRIAAEQIHANLTRSLLTALGVIIGVVAVTLMGTAIQAINTGFQNNLKLLGEDILYVQKWPWTPTQEWWRFRNRPEVETHLAEPFNQLIQEDPLSPLLVAVPAVTTNQRISRAEREVTDVQVTGTTADYILTATAEFASGRFFTEAEVITGTNVVVLGFDVANELFPGINPVGETVRIRNRNFTVIGVYARQGSFLGLFSLDNQAVMPLTAMRKFYRGHWGGSLRIKVRPGADMDFAVGEITGIMRRLRGLTPLQPDNFEINRTEALEETIGPIRNGIALAGLFITGLSLFVGAIGIMNITFVSVKERTREIGTRRALGAPKRAILIQFLIESIAICLVGGLIGLVIALAAGQVAAELYPILPIEFSGALIALALVVSVLTGILSGFAPAWQASRLDPALALRHE